MFAWIFSVFIGGFFIGVFICIGLEALGVYVLINRLNRKIQQQQQQEQRESNYSSAADLDLRQSLDYASHKKGVVWVLEEDKVLKNLLLDEVQNKQKKKKKVIEVTPVQRYAVIKNHSLILTDSRGSRMTILLKGCTVEAVSASNLPSRKWSKRYPIKIENRTLGVWNGSKAVYIYIETAWEKEAWCKALRIASCMDKEQIKWFTKLKEDFHGYVTSLNVGYPTFMKPTTGFHPEQIERADRFDGSTSKVRTFLKKIARKASKAALENKGIHLSGREERKISDGCYLHEAPVWTSSSSKNSVMLGTAVSSEERDFSLHSTSTVSRSPSQSQFSVMSDVESDDRLCLDDGTLCWNLLISRFFFDAKSSAEVKNSVKSRIQRTLSNMRTPSYIGEVVCSGLDLGNLPPYIHGTRVLAAEMNEVWAWEFDIEYSGGLLLDIETRLEVGDQNFEKGMVNTSSESSSVGDVSAELLDGFEDFGRQLNISEGSTGAQDRKYERDSRLDGSRHSTNSTATSTHTSRWKSIVNSIAKQVSQVPLSLSVRVSSLRGTVRMHIKPPPSDQLWFGFTSMPDIDFNLESAVGEHKINNARVALFLINRFKASIRETMVLPNSESVSIPWMLAEKNDWVPRKVAPFIWVNHESSSDNIVQREDFGSRQDEVNHEFKASRRTSSGRLESKHQHTRSSEAIEQPVYDTSDAPARSLSSRLKLPMQSSRSLQDLRTPLLSSNEHQETSQREIVPVPDIVCQSTHDIVCQSPSTPVRQSERQNNSTEEVESRSKQMGRRARMLDLGRRMGEKLEEKRRHIEEKGKHIVEKMRGP